jgi:hypothetical protein
MVDAEDAVLIWYQVVRRYEEERDCVFVASMMYFYDAGCGRHGRVDRKGVLVRPRGTHDWGEQGGRSSLEGRRHPHGVVVLWL